MLSPYKLRYKAWVQMCSRFIFFVRSVIVNEFIIFKWRKCDLWAEQK